MFDWVGDLEKAGIIGKLVLWIADFITNITRSIAETFGSGAVILFLISLPGIIYFIIWLIHEWWTY